MISVALLMDEGSLVLRPSRLSIAGESLERSTESSIGLSLSQFQPRTKTI
jgi:hypothetical protein